MSDGENHDFLLTTKYIESRRVELHLLTLDFFQIALAGKQKKSAAGMGAQIGYSWFCNWHGKAVTCDIILSLSLIETFSIRDKNRQISRTHLLVRMKPKHVLSGSFLKAFWYKLSRTVSELKITQFLKVLGRNTVNLAIREIILSRT